MNVYQSNNMKANHCTFDYHYYLEDEIALEGLDGIALEGLWLRLENRQEFSKNFKLDDVSKSFLWSLIKKNEEIQFYLLPTERPALRILNRHEYLYDMKIVDKKNDVEEIYPFAPVKDESNNIQGSCSTYKSRENITLEAVKFSLNDATKKYGQRLVLVASQYLRDKCLGLLNCGSRAGFTDYMYIMLERIGRSRKFGEISSGRISSKWMKLNSGLISLNKKKLLKLGLIKQQKCIQGNIKFEDAVFTSILHLSRFYTIIITRKDHLIAQIRKLFENSPNNMLPLAEVKAKLGKPRSMKSRASVSAIFDGVFDVVDVTYDVLYPNSEKDHISISDEQKIFITCLRPAQFSPKKGNCVINEKDVCDNVLENDSTYNNDGNKEIMSDNIGEKISLNRIKREHVDRKSDDFKNTETYENTLENDSTSELSEDDADEQCDYSNFRKNKIVLHKSLCQQIYDFVASKGREGATFLEIKHALLLRKCDCKLIEKLITRSILKHKQKYFGRAIKKVFIAPKYFEDLPEKKLKISKINVEKKCSSIEEQKIFVKKEIFQENEISEQFNTSHDNAERRVSLTEIQEKMESVFSNLRITQHYLKRCASCINFLREHRVVKEHATFYNHLAKIEKRDGLKYHIDRKTVPKICDKLVQCQFMKKFVIKMKVGSRFKYLNFYSTLDVTLEDPMLKELIESEKIEQSVKTHHAKVPITDEKHTIHHYLAMKTFKHASYLGNSEEKEIKASPKCVRMAEFHKLIFYLTRVYEGDTNLNQGDAWKKILQESTDTIIEETDEYPPLYMDRIYPFMFVPPLPQYTMTTEKGWVRIMDILIRTPLMIFVQAIKVHYITPLLKEYLAHPVKCNLLVKDLPIELRSVLICRNAFLNCTIDLVKVMVFVGLVQVNGALTDTDRESSFIYVNSKISILDTTSSDSGYLTISQREYEPKHYHFKNRAAVLNFWWDLYIICLHTPLGERSKVFGKQVVSQRSEDKEILNDRLRSVEFSEAKNQENNKLPGDGKGAAGFDSMLFMHLKRNWSFNNTRYKQLWLDELSNTKEGYKSKVYSYADYLRTSCLQESVDKDIQIPIFKSTWENLNEEKEEESSVNTMKPLVRLVENDKVAKRNSTKDLLSNKPPTKKPRSKRGKEYKRVITKPKKKERLPMFDDVDMAAQKKLRKIRVDWSSNENSHLVLCKVANIFLFSNTGISVTRQVRDILHKHCAESANKTSRACQRRILYLMKDPVLRNKINTIVHELTLNEELRNGIVPYSTVPRHKEKECAFVFRELVERLIRNYGSNYQPKNTTELPETVEEFNEHFSIVLQEDKSKPKYELKPVQRRADIDKYVIQNLIFTALCSEQDKTSYGRQLLSAYESYPQQVLNAARVSLHNSAMISFRKNKSKFTRTSLPLSSYPFQFSALYIYRFGSKYSYKIYEEAWQFMKLFSKSKALKNKKSANRKRKISQTIEKLETVSFGSSDVSSSETRDIESLDVNLDGGACMTIITALAKNSLEIYMRIPDKLFSTISDKRKEFLMKELKEHFNKSHRLTIEDYREGTLSDITAGASDMAADANDITADESVVTADKGDITAGTSDMTDDNRVVTVGTSNLSDTITGASNIPTSVSNATAGTNASLADESDATLVRSDRSAEIAKINKRKKEYEGLVSKKQKTNDSISAEVNQSLIENDRNLNTEDKLTEKHQNMLKIDQNLPINDQSIDRNDSNLTENDQNLTKKDENLTENEQNLTKNDENLTGNYQNLKNHQISTEKPDSDSSNLTFHIDENFSEVFDDLDDINYSDERIEKLLLENIEESVPVDRKRILPIRVSRLKNVRRRELLRLDGTEDDTRMCAHNFILIKCPIACDLKLSDDFLASKNCSSVKEVKTAPGFEKNSANDHDNTENSNLNVDMPGCGENSSNNLANRSRIKSLDVLVDSTIESDVSRALKISERVLLEYIGDLKEAVELWKSENRDVNFILMIFNMIDESGYLGVSFTDIKSWCEKNERNEIHNIVNDRIENNNTNPSEKRNKTSAITIGLKEAMDIINTLIETNLVIRTGVDQFRWISVSKAKIWLTKSDRIPNHKMREMNVRVSGIYRVSAAVPENGSVEASQNRDAENELNEENVMEISESEEINATLENMEITPETDRSSTRVYDRYALQCASHRKPSTENLNIEDAAVEQQKKEEYPIHIIARPWVRLNGNLIRRALDRFLGSILFYIMRNPSITGSNLTSYFWPALQPVHTYELLEILITIRAVNSFRISAEKIGLFSKTKPSRSESSALDLYYEDSHYEATVDCVLRLSTFIGDKKYNFDFLASKLDDVANTNLVRNDKHETEPLLNNP